jgi:5-methylcytosine-specific restriction endonuclease McrA
MTSRLHRSRLLAFNCQGGNCFYCGLPTWLTEPKGPKALRCTAEHLTARSEGGSDEPANIAAACAHCNHTRHKRKHPPEPERFRDEVRRRLRRGGWHQPSVMAWARSKAST